MLNKVVFQGRFTADPELKQTQSGVSYCKFTTAWSEKYKEVETQCFLECSSWRQNAEFISKYFKKGDQAIVEGRLVTNKWQDKDGNNCTTIVCEVDKCHFCGAKSGSQSVENNSATTYHVSPQNAATGASGASVTAPQFEIVDDKLPW